MRTHQYYVYIVTNVSHTLYIGVTKDLVRRMWEHKQGIGSGFTSRYHLTMLVHFEVTEDVRAAIAREKELKGWVRREKVALIEETNPNWEDLSEPWFRDELTASQPRC